MKLTLTFLLILFSAMTASAQYEVSVTTIPVWVKVQDKAGNPVRGLTEQDFELFEEGKRVPTSCFEEINLEEQPAASAPSAVNATPAEQKFVIFLDLFNTTPREYASVKPALQSFVDSFSGKKVEIMLAALLPDRRLGIISRFTTDHRRIRVLLDYAKANPKRDVEVREREKEMAEALSSGPASRKVDVYEDRAIDGYQVARVIARQEEESSRHTLHAIETFSEHLSRLDLRSHATMILVSGGFSVDPARKYYNIADKFGVRGTQGANNMVANSNRLTGFTFQEEVQQSIGKLNRLNVTMYSIDTRGNATEKEYQDSLIQIASETGGLSFFNSDNFSVGLQQVQKDIRHQYLLCYSPPEHKSLGKYYNIKVNVRKSGVTVRHRDGYWE